MRSSEFRFDLICIKHETQAYTGLRVCNILKDLINFVMMDKVHLSEPSQDGWTSGGPGPAGKLQVLRCRLWPGQPQRDGQRGITLAYITAVLLLKSPAFLNSMTFIF